MVLCLRNSVIEIRALFEKIRGVTRLDGAQDKNQV